MGVRTADTMTASGMEFSESRDANRKKAACSRLLAGRLENANSAAGYFRTKETLADRSLFWLEKPGSAFASNKNLCGRCNFKFPGVVALIDGDAHASARVDIQKGFADGHVHKIFSIRYGQRPVG